MIRIVFEKMYADMFVGSIILEKKKMKKLATVCIDRKRPFTFLGKPIKLDGTYQLKYGNFHNDGYHFRPVVNKRTMEVRMLDPDNPTPSRKGVLWICEKKARWEKVCKNLLIAKEYFVTIENYDNREQLPVVEEKFLHSEDEMEDPFEEFEDID